MSQIKSNVSLFYIIHDHIEIEKLSIVGPGLGIRIKEKAQNGTSKTTTKYTATKTE
jgi:hypothetical protein